MNITDVVCIIYSFAANREQQFTISSKIFQTSNMVCDSNGYIREKETGNVLNLVISENVQNILNRKSHMCRFISTE